ncbi:MAG: VCBS repeat-containing protein, partial [Candidatus Zixiibacteriota bacterium]
MSIKAIVHAERGGRKFQQSSEVHHTGKSREIKIVLSILLSITGVLLATTGAYAFDPMFQASIDYGVGDNPSSVFAADLDGDGDRDLAVANYWSHNVSILPNNGDGTFAAAVNYTAGDFPASVFAADLDADGDQDLAVVNITLSSSVSI